MKNIFFLLFTLASLFLSCSQSDTCLSPKVVALRGGFYYQKNDSTLSDTTLINANLIFGIPGLFYQQNIKNNSQFAFTLPQTSDSIDLYFQSDSLSVLPEHIDTIHLYFNRTLHFISTACGYETYYTIKKFEYTHHVIDSAIINYTSINNDVNKEHIYFVLKK